MTRARMGGWPLAGLVGIAAAMVTVDSLAVTEVLVTARKREENQQVVPIAISTIDERTIERQGIASLEDISRLTASLSVETGFSPQDIRITIRGLYPTQGRQNVAVLQDGIDISSQAIQTNGGGLLINPRLFDLERVEVVKGPQNALYGRTAFNGAINYITRRPGEEFDGRVGTDIGSDGQLEFRGSLSGPVMGDTLLAGINAATWEHDGYYRNSVTGDRIGGGDGYGVAGTLVWRARENFRATLRGEYTDDEFQPRPYFTIVPTTPIPIPEEAITLPADAPPGALPVLAPSLTSIVGVTGKLPSASGLAPTNADDPRTGSDYPGTTREIGRGTLTLEWELDGFALTSLTHLANAKTFQFEDSQRSGPSSLPFGGETWFDEDTDLFSQELRLQSTGDNIVDWTVGALYWKERTDFLDGSAPCVSVATFVPFPPPGFFAPPGSCSAVLAALGTGASPRNEDLWERDTEHKSVYFLLDWQFHEQWQLILEGRYTEEELDVLGPDRLANDANPFNDRNRAVDSRGIIFGTTILPAVGVIPARDTDSFFSPKATLQWQAAANQMYYFSWAQGTKPSGIAIVGNLAGFVPDTSRFKAEELQVWELGAKTDWLEGTLRANAALFFQDYTDKQVSSQIVNAAGLLQPAPVNASEAEVWGLELELAWQATENLLLSGAYTYLDTEYKDYQQNSRGPAPIAAAGNCTRGGPDANNRYFCILDLSGNELEYSPDHSFVGSVAWRAPLVGGTDWFAEADLKYQGERYQNSFNTVKFDSYTTADFRVGVSNQQWDVIAYVNNAFDDDTIQTGFSNTYLGGYGAATPPFTIILPNNQSLVLPDQRQFGLRVNYRFGRM